MATQGRVRSSAWVSERDGVFLVVAVDEVAEVLLLLALTDDGRLTIAVADRVDGRWERRVSFRVETLSDEADDVQPAAHARPVADLAEVLAFPAVASLPWLPEAA